METLIMTIVVAIIGSGLINLLIQRHWDKSDQLNEIQSGLKSLSDKIDENEATQSRNHILRFDDEITSNYFPHSKEYYKSILDDIDIYEQYCKDHPNFRNSYTVEANKHIRQAYEKMRDKGKF